MTTTITHGASTILPTLLLAYEVTRVGGNIVHPILGRANPDVTYRPAGMRTGRLMLGFSSATSEADSKSAEDLFGSGQKFVLTDSDLPSIAMSFVVPQGGRIVRTLEDATRAAWTIDIDFQEVSA